MIIKLKTFKINSKEYFRIITKNYFKKQKFIYIFIMIFAIFYLFFFPIKSGVEYYLLPIFLFSIPFYYMFYFLIYAKSNKNKFLFKEINLSFDEKFIYATYNDGSSIQINWKNIVALNILKRYYILYSSKNQFLIFPKDKFLNIQDETAFLKLAKSKLQ